MASSISSAFKHGLGPYQAKITATVVGACPERTYIKDGEDRHVKVAALHDGHVMARLHVYDQSKFNRLQTGNVLTILNSITKKEDGQMVVSATKKSKIFSGRTEDVTAEILAQADAMLNPPPAITVPIITALRSPTKTKVSVKGKITQEGEPQTVRVQGADVPIKHIHITDATGTTKVTLWREACEAQVRPGDYVEITDTITNTWKNTTSLSTTSRSKLSKCDAPEDTQTGEIVGASCEEDHVEFLLDNDQMITVSKDMVTAALVHAGSDCEVESIACEGPVKPIQSQETTMVETPLAKPSSRATVSSTDGPAQNVCEEMTILATPTTEGPAMNYSEMESSAPWEQSHTTNGVPKVRLVPEHEVYLTSAQVSQAKHRACGQPRKLVINFLDVLFSRETLAKSCALGSKSAHNKTTTSESLPLPPNALSAIKLYILRTFKKDNGEACMTERAFNDAVNAKCATARRAERQNLSLSY